MWVVKFDAQTPAGLAMLTSGDASVTSTVRFHRVGDAVELELSRDPRAIPVRFRDCSEQTSMNGAIALKH